jgi:hypothetical protein
MGDRQGIARQTAGNFSQTALSSRDSFARIGRTQLNQPIVGMAAI